MIASPFQLSAHDEDARACRAFIRGTHHPSAAFVCVGDSGRIEATGATNMSVLQLMGLAHAVLTSAKRVLGDCPGALCLIEAHMIDQALAALNPASTEGGKH